MQFSIIPRISYPSVGDTVSVVCVCVCVCGLTPLQGIQLQCILCGGSYSFAGDTVSVFFVCVGGLLLLCRVYSQCILCGGVLTSL